MTIAIVTALVGAIASLALVRQRDFVPSIAMPPAAPAGGPAGGPASPAGGPARPRPRHAHSKRANRGRPTTVPSERPGSAQRPASTQRPGSDPGSPSPVPTNTPAG